MALHRLNRITIGVPNVEVTARYYADFGLERGTGAAFSTIDGGEQLALVGAPRRRLVELRIGADDADDLGRIAASLARPEIPTERTETEICAYEPGTAVAVVVEVAPRLVQEETLPPPYNAPGFISRPNSRAPGILRDKRVRPRKLGHVVLGSTDQDGSQRFFSQGLGFKISDTVAGLASFLRCSTDHHNVLVQQAPLAYLHHTSWQVNDVDEVGRAATAMLEADPSRHVWGLGRHHVGSNFFWYLRDPAGNFLRVLFRPRLHRGRRPLDRAGLGGRTRAVQLGAATATAAVVPRARGLAGLMASAHGAR